MRRTRLHISTSAIRSFRHPLFDESAGNVDAVNKTFGDDNAFTTGLSVRSSSIAKNSGGQNWKSANRIRPNYQSLYCR